MNTNSWLTGNHNLPPFEERFGDAYVRLVALVKHEETENNLSPQALHTLRELLKELQIIANTAYNNESVAITRVTHALQDAKNSYQPPNNAFEFLAELRGEQRHWSHVMEKITQTLAYELKVDFNSVGAKRAQYLAADPKTHLPDNEVNPTLPLRAFL